MSLLGYVPYFPPWHTTGHGPHSPVSRGSGADLKASLARYEAAIESARKNQP